MSCATMSEPRRYEQGNVCGKRGLRVLFVASVQSPGQLLRLHKHIHVPHFELIQVLAQSQGYGIRRDAYLAL